MKPDIYTRAVLTVIATMRTAGKHSLFRGAAPLIQLAQ